MIRDSSRADLPGRPLQRSSRCAKENEGALTLGAIFIPSDLFIFLASLILSIVSAIVLLQDLDRIGARLRLSEGLLGLLAALGSNAPEISAAVVAMKANNHDLGLGVVLGSNIFNLAALLGLSAVVSGVVRISRQGLILNGTVSVVVALIAVAIVLRWIEAGLGLVLLLAVLGPYVIIFSLRPGYWTDPTRPPGAAKRFLIAAVAHAHHDARHDEQPRRGSWTDFLSIVPALVCIVLSSVGMVSAATSLGLRWHISNAVIGTLLLAALTSIPNVIAAVRLAIHHRGSAVVSESLNSNTLNVLAGICLPVLVLGSGDLTPMLAMSAWWLLAMTLIAVILTYIGGGLYRWEGAALIIIYVIFATIIAMHG